MNLRPFVYSVLASAFLLPMHAMGESEARDQNASRVHVPHIFNGDSPVVLVQETEFHSSPYCYDDGEEATTLVVGKALGGIGTNIAPGSVVLLAIQGKEEEPDQHRNGRRLYIAQVNESLARPLHPSGSTYYIDGVDFTCFGAAWLLKMNPEELKPEWKQLYHLVDSLQNPAIPTAAELSQQPAPGSPEQLLFTACSRRQGTDGRLGMPCHRLSPKVHAIIASGTDVNARCNDLGMTPLMQAALHNDSVACSLLLRAGADPNLRDINGMTALNYALIGKDLPTKQFGAFGALLPWGTRIDMRCTPPQGAAYKGATPLHHAVLVNSSDAAWDLLRKGADATAKDDAGRTPLDLAREFDRTELIPILENALNK